MTSPSSPSRNRAPTRRFWRLIDEAAPYWPCPILNHPAAIARLTRDGAWRLLRDVEALHFPENRRLDRAALAKGDGGAYPLIIRPVDSHAGEELEKIEHAAELGAYLRGHAGDEFYVAPFVDYAGADGKYRKIRIALIDGKAWPIHYAVSSRWMVHYLNADMLHNRAHRAEEEVFMRDFDAFRRATRGGARRVEAPPRPRLSADRLRGKRPTAAC